MAGLYTLCIVPTTVQVLLSAWLAVRRELIEKSYWSVDVNTMALSETHWVFFPLFKRNRRGEMDPLANTTSFRVNVSNSTFVKYRSENKISYKLVLVIKGCRKPTCFHCRSAVLYCTVNSRVSFHVVPPAVTSCTSALFHELCQLKA